MSPPYEVVALSAVTWAVIGADGASNAAFAATADGAIMVDTLSSLAASSRLAEHVRARAGQPRAIVLTHHHADHWAGLGAAGAWDDIPVYAHPRMVAILESIAAEYGLSAGDTLPFPALLRLWVGDAAAAELGADSDNGVVVRLRALAEREPVRFWLPLPIAPGTSLAEGPTSVQVDSCGRGHGDDDLVVRIDDGGRRVMILGDQGFFGRVPVVGGPYIDEWLGLLEQLAGLGEPTLLIPGHGPVGAVGGADDSAATFLREQAAYLHALRNGAGDELPPHWSSERSRDWHKVNLILAGRYYPG